MIRQTKVIFCENEHGTGDVTFPEMSTIDTFQFIVPLSQAQLRKQAKKEGWSRHNGSDYCPTCTESL